MQSADSLHSTATLSTSYRPYGGFLEQRRWTPIDADSRFWPPEGRYLGLPKLIVYHLDKSITAQLAEIGLKPGDIGRVAISHTHGDHIGNMALFPNATVLMQHAEYNWIHSPNGPNDNVNQLMALARQLLGTPKQLQLVDGDTDVFGDGSVTLLSTPGHTPGHQSLLVHLKSSGFIPCPATLFIRKRISPRTSFHPSIPIRRNQSPRWPGSGS